MKKFLLMALSVITVAALAITGTIAYLTSEDSDVNVMTTGNVKIAQHEYERVVDADGNYTTIDVDGVTSYELKEFTQGKPLLPFVGEVDNGYDPIPVRLAQLGHNSRGGMDVLPAKNVQDKFVVVENTGKFDAYVRTIVAFEAGSVVEEDWFKIVKYSAHFTWNETKDWFVTEIDGNNYYLVEFVYNGYEDIQHPNGVLTPGDFTYNSLAQVYLFDTATNEDCEALDGNKNGTFDILVLSQAVQTAGFDNAKTALDAGFGEFNEDNVKDWFTGMEWPVIPVGFEVSNDAELAAAVEAGETEIWLNPGTYHAPNAAKGKTLTINGTKNSVLEIVPVGAGEANGQLDYNFDSSTVTFNGITIKTNNQTYAGYARLTGTYNNCTFNGHYCLQRDSVFTECTLNVTGDQYNAWTWGAPNVTFDRCTFNSDGKALMLYGAANTKLTINNCVFNDTGILPDLKAAVEIGNDYGTSYELIINNTVVNGYEINDKGINTGSTLWANKNSMPQDKLNVVVDGVDVY